MGILQLQDVSTHGFAEDALWRMQTARPNPMALVRMPKAKQS